MKQLVCEMCGGTNLIKEDGVFVCKTCGCKYSVEEARKLMTDGTGDMQGTVPLKRSPEVDNILKNADATFSDGNYEKAFDLYSQFLNKEPDNAHAVLYRAISSTWQSTVKDCRIGEIDRATERAFGMKHDQVGDTLEYFEFVADALKKIAPCMNAIAQMYMNYYERATPTSITITGAMATAGIAEQVEEIMKKGIFNCCTIVGNLANYALRGVSDYTYSTDGYWDIIRTILKNTETYCLNAGMPYNSIIDRIMDNVKDKKKDADTQRAKYAAEQREKALREQKERNEAYWAEHATEKAELEDEKEKLKVQLSSMKAEYDEIMEKRGPGIDELRKLRNQKIPEELECDKKRELIGDLERQKSACGIFKGKEKKEIQAKIDSEETKLSDMRKAAQDAKEKYQEEINKQINEIQHSGQDIINEYEKIQARMNKILTELSKNR